ncbi:hypothetical protein TI04_02790 [Achromatium sp. WMS2]|nr:hypothetical protein TI04_02790 [Achromatium sp. WMS2]
MAEIWITGAGVISALGNDFDTFAAGLRRGEDQARPITAFDASGVKGHMGYEVRDLRPSEHFSSQAIRRMDRASMLLLVAAREAMGRAGLGPKDYAPERAMIAMGNTLGGMINATEYLAHLKATGHGYASQLIDYPLYGAGARFAAEYKIWGANLAFSVACSSSNVAIGTAADAIRLGEADLAVAGGFDTIAKITVAGFNTLRNVSPERCRPFDKNRQGLVLGEGAGVLILESAIHARARGATPMAKFLGYGMSSDAYHMTAPDVTGRGPARAIEAALRNAKLEPTAIDYINAHGTGTTHNDAVESKAIRRVLGEHAHKIPVSSTKSMHGHTLGAAGAIEAVAILAGMRHGFFPPTVNHQETDPECGLDCVPNVARPGQIHVALSNNFGFGGNNCSILLGAP